MVSYFISKVFFEIWDHLTWNVLHSLAVILLTALLVGAFSTGISWLMVPAVFVSLAGFYLTGLVYLRHLEAPTDFAWGPAIRAVLILALVQGLVLTAGVFASWFYLSQGQVLTQGLGFLVLWIILFWFIGNLLTLPLLLHFQFDLLQAFRTSWYLFLRSPLLFFLAFFSGIILMATTAIILPGCGGQLVMTRTLRDILKRKYDWLAAQDKPPRTIPWREILGEDIAAIEHRDLKSLLTPWK